MESDADAVERVTQAPAFKRRFKTRTKHDASRFLPDDPEYAVMRICVSAAGDAAKGSEWYETKPLSEVYKWLAIKLAEGDDSG